VLRAIAVISHRHGSILPLKPRLYVLLDLLCEQVVAVGSIDFLPMRIRDGRREQEALGVRMLGARCHDVPVPVLDELPSIHHRHPMAAVAHDAQVVAAVPSSA
jgi:hypothetical protein